MSMIMLPHSPGPRPSPTAWVCSGCLQWKDEEPWSTQRVVTFAADGPLETGDDAAAAHFTEGADTEMMFSCRSCTETEFRGELYRGVQQRIRLSTMHHWLRVGLGLAFVMGWYSAARINPVDIYSVWVYIALSGIYWAVAAHGNRQQLYRFGPRREP